MARQARKRETYQGFPCKRGHPGLRYLSSKACVDCRLTKTVTAIALAESKKWYHDNKDRAVTRSRAYRATPRGKALQMLGSIRSRSKKWQLSTDIDQAWLAHKLEVGKCELSGLPFHLGLSEKSPFSPSIDRIDSKLGYTKDNCRIILWGLNIAFCNWGEDVFTYIAKAWLERKL